MQKSRKIAPPGYSTWLDVMNSRGREKYCSEWKDVAATSAGEIPYSILPPGPRRDLIESLRERDTAYIATFPEIRTESEIDMINSVIDAMCDDVWTKLLKCAFQEDDGTILNIEHNWFFGREGRLAAETGSFLGKYILISSDETPQPAEFEEIETNIGRPTEYDYEYGMAVAYKELSEDLNGLFGKGESQAKIEIRKSIHRAITKDSVNPKHGRLDKYASKVLIWLREENDKILTKSEQRFNSKKSG